MIITVRPEQQADIDDIYELNKLAFGQENEEKQKRVAHRLMNLAPDRNNL